MEWVNIKQFRLFLPPGQDGFIGCFSLERRALFSAIIGAYKAAQMGFELVYAVIMVCFSCGLLDGSVHTLYLAMGLGAIGPCGLMANPVFLAGPSEAVAPGRAPATPACSRPQYTTHLALKCINGSVCVQAWSAFWG